MKPILLAIVAAAAIAASPAIAQPPTDTAAPAAAAATGKISVQTTKISELIKNPAAKAALEKALPPISEYYDQIGDMTLTDVAPMSQGALDENGLKALQAEFDKLP